MFRAFPLILSLLLLAACSKKKPALPSSVVLVEAVRVAASKAKSPQDILPYDEAIAWHEYDVRKVLSGSLDGATRVRVAHWSVRHGKAMPLESRIGQTVTLTLKEFAKANDQRGLAASDDLEILADEPPRFYDATWELADAAKPEHARCDYWGTVSDQMKIYWTLRSQLRLVIMGNSHATKGVCPRPFYGDENWKTPVAMNLAPPGSSNPLQCLILRDYVAPLPKMEWIVWVMSPRNFNGIGDENRKLRDFLGSPGYHYDQEHHGELFPVKPDQPLAYMEDLKKLEIDVTDWWGWEGRNKSRLPETLEEARPGLVANLQKVNFQFSDSIWNSFTSTVDFLTSKGLRILLVTPPFHPITAETPADPDGSSHEGQRELVRRLTQLVADKKHVWFRDYNKDGHNDFTHTEFYDEDHLTRTGSLRWTKQIMDWMDQCAQEK